MLFKMLHSFAFSFAKTVSFTQSCSGQNDKSLALSVSSTVVRYEKLET